MNTPKFESVVLSKKEKAMALATLTAGLNVTMLPKYIESNDYNLESTFNIINKYAELQLAIILKSVEKD